MKGQQLATTQKFDISVTICVGGTILADAILRANPKHDFAKVDEFTDKIAASIKEACRAMHAIGAAGASLN